MSHKDLVDKQQADLCEPERRNRVPWKTFLVLAVLAIVPVYIFGYMLPGRGRFLGLIHNPGDTSQYLALARQYQEHCLLIARNPFTHEPHSPFLIQPFLSFIGLLCRVVPLRCHTAYAIVSIFVATWLLGAAWRFCQVVFSRRQEAFWAWMLLTFAGGANSLLLLQHVFAGGHLLEAPYRSALVDSNNLLTVLVGSPFRAILYVLIFTSWTVLLRSRIRSMGARTVCCGISDSSKTPGSSEQDSEPSDVKARPLLFAGFLLLLVGFCHAYDAPFLILSIVIWTVLDILFDQVSTRRERCRNGAFFLQYTIPWLIPPIVHALYVVTIHPVGKKIAEIPQPTPGMIPFLWWVQGLVSVGIVFWLVFEFVDSPLRKAQSRFLFATLIAAVVLRLLPVRYAGRLAEPFDYPALLIGVSGWFRLLRSRSALMVSLSERQINSVFCFLFLISMPITVYSHARRFIEIAKPSFERRIYYLQDEELRMIEWIDKNVPSDEVILASRSVSLHIPRLTGCSVYVGHPVLTPDFWEKQAFLDDFFSPEYAHEARQSFLNQHGIRYVFYGERERQLGRASILFTPIFRVAHREGDVYLLEVQALHTKEPVS